jgi:peptidoglycan/LPS O-acetylase OafA/YrhL
MLFHAGVGPFSGGYVGVDVFFVISGYLITGIIYREIEEQRFSFVKFYERRARRIFPALYLVSLVSLIPAWFFLIPSDLIEFSESLIGVVGFVSNIVFWQQSNYFSVEAELKPLLHTWSLAVEEQFYVLFPIALIVVYRFARPYLLTLMSLAAAVSLMLSHFGAINFPSANYYLLPTRAWELLTGSTIALWHRIPANLFLARQSQSFCNLISAIGLGLVATSILWFDNDTPYPSLWTALPVTGTALMLIFATQGTYAHKILSNRLFVAIGLISYSAYLWHQPVYAFLRQQYFVEVSDAVMTSGLVLSLFLAYLTWKYIEQPYRDRDRVSPRKIWLSSLCVALVLVGFAAFTIERSGFEGRFTMRQPLTPLTFALPERKNGWCFYSVDSDPTLEIGPQGQSCFIGARESSLTGLLFGDSHAGMYEPFWDKVGTQIGARIRAVTTNWCSPSFTRLYPWSKETRAYEQCLLNRVFVERSIEDYDFVIIAGSWSTMGERALQDSIELVRFLSSHRDLKIIIMAQPPQLSRASVMRSVYVDGQLERNEGEDKAKLINADFQNFANRRRNTFFISREQLFEYGIDSTGYLSREGVPYALDGNHISIYGSLQAAQNFRDNGSISELRNFLQGRISGQRPQKKINESDSAP